MKNNDWEKCFKIRCTPPIEVYADGINFFGNNIDIDQIDRVISDKQKHVDYLKEAKEIWEKEFKLNHMNDSLQLSEGLVICNNCHYILCYRCYNSCPKCGLVVYMTKDNQLKEE